MTYKYLVIHHSASPRETTVEDIRRWHTDPSKPGGPFRDIGYHYIVTGDAKLAYGRSIWEIGAHTRGYNQISIGLCITGNNTKERDHWTMDQILCAQSVIESVRLLIPGIQVVGHRDLSPTQCPGREIKSILL